MELNFPVTAADYRAFYEWSTRHEKPKHRREFYQTFWFYLGFFLFASVLAFKHEEWVALSLFAYFGIFYAWKSHSFTKHWNAAAESYAAKNTESNTTIVIEDDGITDVFAGDIALRVPWQKFDCYAVFDKRLFLSFLKARAVIIPLDSISAADHEALMRHLATHRIPQAAE